MAPAVAEAMTRALQDAWGNPSSGHPAGAAAREAVEAARVAVADLVGAHPDEVVFLSGGTEANHTALRAVPAGKRVIATAVEHPSVQAALHAADPTAVHWWPVDADGVLHWSASDLVDAGLVTVMLANNETGVCHPVGDIARQARGAGCLVHTDAAQAVGKVPVDFKALGVDYLTVVGHKLYGPKGIGALVVRRGAPFVPLFSGGGQEKGRRAGTEPVPAIVGLGVACAEARQGLAVESQRQASLRDRLEQVLIDQIPGLRRTGANQPRLPNTAHLRFPGVVGRELLSRVEGLAASTGAACHDGTDAPSPVLTAMGIDRADALGAVRLSLGRTTRPEHIDEVAAALVSAWRAELSKGGSR